MIINSKLNSLSGTSQAQRASSTGRIRRINFSQPQSDSHLAISIDKVEAWYRALKKLYDLALHSSNLFQFKLEPSKLLKALENV